MIYVSSMAMLDSARRGLRTPALARWMLGTGIAATLAVNVLAGLHSGGMGSVIAAWPALALVGSYELLMAMVRREAVPATGDLPSAGEAAGTVAAGIPAAPATVPRTVAASVPGIGSAPVPASVPVSTVASVPGPVPVARVRAEASGRASSRAQPIRQKSAEKAFAAELAAGEVPSLRAIKERMRVGTDRAREIRERLAAAVQEVPKAA